MGLRRQVGKQEGGCGQDGGFQTAQRTLRYLRSWGRFYFLLIPEDTKAKMRMKMKQNKNNKEKLTKREAQTELKHGDKDRTES